MIEVGRYWLIEDQPAVAADGDGFAVVWRRSFSGRPDLQLVGTRVTGPAVPEAQMIGDAGPVSEPALDCEGSGPCLVAWTVGTDNSPRDVLARAWTPRAGTADSETLPVAVTDLPEFAPSVAWNGAPDASAYVLTWSVESRYRAVYARSARGGTAGSTGTANGPAAYVLGPALEVAMGLGGSYAPDVDAMGSAYVTVYSVDSPLPEWRGISATRMRYAGDTGSLSTDRYVTVTQSEIRSSFPAVNAGREPDALVVWQDSLGPRDNRIVGRYASIAASGTKPPSLAHRSGSGP